MQGLIDDAHRIRLRLGEAEADQTRELEYTGEGAACFVGKTIACSSYPTTAAVMYCVAAVGIMGTETEGSSGVFTVQTPTLKALNVGSAIPPSGTLLVVTRVPNRWVFRYDG
jgi:hypothetical protein